MSPQNRPSIAGLAAPGLLWLATSVAWGQAPAIQGPPTPAPTSPRTYEALLMSNGKVVKGDIIEDASAGVYRLRTSGGSVPYPKTMILKAGRTIEELYQFQVARLPVGDPDERMKLVRWCLSEHLTAQAKEQLLAVGKICPNDKEVERMLANFEANEGRMGVDPDIRRTSGEMPRGDAPATLDPRVFVKAQKRFNALPEIFDLPPAQAVKRANEFADYVQPVLQQSCVKCHNEKYQGGFQLVEIKLRKDLLNPDIARANLDATLRLVNPKDPTRSELLSAGLVPHGGSKNAIFRGPNDRSYLVLLTWVKSLKPAAAPGGLNEPVSKTGFPNPEPLRGDRFATERTTRPMAPLPDEPRSGLPRFPDTNTGVRTDPLPTPPSRRVDRTIDEKAEFFLSAEDKPEFPTAYPPGTLPPRMPRDQPGAGSPKDSTSSDSTVVPKTATPAGPGAVKVGPTDNPNQLPGMNQPLYPTSPGAETKDAPPKKKTTKIDPALLEQLIKSRNSSGTP